MLWRERRWWNVSAAARLVNTWWKAVSNFISKFLGKIQHASTKVCFEWRMSVLHKHPSHWVMDCILQKQIPILQLSWCMFLECAWDTRLGLFYLLTPVYFLSTIRIHWMFGLCLYHAIVLMVHGVLVCFSDSLWEIHILHSTLLLSNWLKCLLMYSWTLCLIMYI